MYNGTPERENHDVRKAWQNSSAVMECTGRASGVKPIRAAVDEGNNISE